MTSTTTSTVCSPSCWHTPWPVVPGDRCTGRGPRAQPGSDTVKFVNVPLDVIYKYYTSEPSEVSLWCPSLRGCTGFKPRMWKSAVNRCHDSASLQWAWARSLAKSTHPGMRTGRHLDQPHLTRRRQHRQRHHQWVLRRYPQVHPHSSWANRSMASKWQQPWRMAPSYARSSSEADAKPSLVPRRPIVVRQFSERTGFGAFNHGATNCTNKRWQTPEEEAAASFGSDGLEPQEGRPLMADLMADPNAPHTKAFIMQLWMALPDSGLAFGPEPWSSRWEKATIPQQPAGRSDLHCCCYRLLHKEQDTGDSTAIRRWTPTPIWGVPWWTPPSVGAWRPESWHRQQGLQLYVLSEIQKLRDRGGGGVSVKTRPGGLRLKWQCGSRDNGATLPTQPARWVVLVASIKYSGTMWRRSSDGPQQTAIMYMIRKSGHPIRVMGGESTPPRRRLSTQQCWPLP